MELPTILDVAEKAGVSRSTVSRVLTNSNRVDPETRHRVLAAIKEINYQPSQVARNLRRQKTNLIAVLIPGISNPFFGSLVQGMEEVAVKKGYNVILCNTGEDPAREIEYLRMLERKQVDGVIMTALRNPLEKVEAFLKYGPIVLASEYTDDDSIPAVMIDNGEAACKVTEHLILKGHMRIGFINGPGHIILCRDRQKGYVQTLEKYAIPVSDDLIICSDFSIEGGFECAKQLLKLEEKPTAIFAANDEMAVGVIQAVKEQGLRVPQDVSVAGFDNVQISRVVQPHLTTVDQPIFQIGVKSVELLMSCLEESVLEGKRMVLEANLCIREST
ncbi:LacI family DNA-binding transcriptional regulator [Paenibacillus sp. BR2-3]|uniref:LacI family DNA-binding transcriptional regulator n=1 Tax=Paenibacillus sp. BR2-3 TaxID=3048494 RepID=UPI003977D1D4